MSSLLLLMSRPHPISTLSPYTTLFRSVSVTNTTREEWDRVLGVNLHGAFHCSKHVIPSIQRKGGGAVVNIASVNSFQDRKSTRLNSSHSQISYAVFCLKKKSTYNRR